MLFVVIFLMAIVIVLALKANTIIGYINAFLEKEAAKKEAEAKRIAEQKEAERLAYLEEFERRAEQKRLDRERKAELAAQQREAALKEAEEASKRFNERAEALQRNTQPSDTERYGRRYKVYGPDGSISDYDLRSWQQSYADHIIDRRTGRIWE